MNTSNNVESEILLPSTPNTSNLQPSSTPSKENENDPIFSDPNVSRNLYWKGYRQVNQEVQNLESIIQSLSSPMKNNVLTRVVEKRPIKDILTHTSCKTQNEAIVCNTFITRLKNLYGERRFPSFHRTLNEFFSDQVDDENFLA